MYAALLARKYLTSKVIPLLAALAVMLSVATELIVWSVMGGFLTSFVEQARQTDGDLRIGWEHVGFAYYDDLVRRLEAHEAVEAAAPLIKTLGLVGLPDDRLVSVQLLGVEPQSYARATVYEESLYWRPQDTPNRLDRLGEDPRLDPQSHPTLERWLRDGRRLAERAPGEDEPSPAIVLGIAATGWNARMPGNWYVPRLSDRLLPSGEVELAGGFLPQDSVRVTVLPLSRGGSVDALDLRTLSFPVANELYTGNYAVDARLGVLPLGVLQEMLQLGEARRVAGNANPFAFEVGPDGVERAAPPPVVGDSPARVTDVLVRAADGVGSSALLEACRSVYALFASDYRGRVPSADVIDIRTFEERNAGFIGAVQKETTLVLFIFGVVSLTSVFLVLAIFWAMVSEKTRDIGVLRALGGSRLGVGLVWVGYGLAIGVVGSAFGALVAALVVRNINPIHEWLGEALGVRIWDPSVYYFTTIPTDLDARKFTIIVAGGVVASVLGALVPAARAAFMDPVRALRFD